MRVFQGWSSMWIVRSADGVTEDGQMDSWRSGQTDGVGGGTGVDM